MRMFLEILGYIFFVSFMKRFLDILEYILFVSFIRGFLKLLEYIYEFYFDDSKIGLHMI